MSFICIRIRNHYQINSFAFSLALKQRFEATLIIYYLIIAQTKKLINKIQGLRFFLFPAHLLCFVTCGKPCVTIKKTVAKLTNRRS